MKNKIIFGTGDNWRAPTLTANMGFVRAILQTGMSLLTLEHTPCALIGDQDFHCHTGFGKHQEGKQSHQLIKLGLYNLQDLEARVCENWKIKIKVFDNL